MTISLHTFPQYQEQFSEFFDCYEVKNAILCGDVPPSNQRLLPPRLRRCRFCGRDRSQTTFKKRAHLLPHLLGNQYVLSDSECDSCNETFSKHESDLANFLGIGRTIHGVRAKESIPTFKSSDKLVTARLGEMLGIKKGIRIERHALGNDAIKVMDELGRTEINVVKQPYVPIRVYKALFKMAMAVLPLPEVSNYTPMLDMLMSEVHDTDYGMFCTVAQYQLPTTYRAVFPHSFLFQKLDPSGQRVMHQFYLRYQDQVFVMPLPLHRLDVELGLYHDEIVHRLSPPLIPHEAEDEVQKCSAQVRDFSGREPVREAEVITLQGMPNAISQTLALDKDTGLPSPAEFNPDEIIGIFMAPQGSSITPGFTQSY